MISVVCWMWKVVNRPAEFCAQHVNIVRAMFARHYSEPHRFICMTDMPKGLDPRIEAITPPVKFENIPAPAGVRYPSSYRRLWNFSPEAKAVLGERILAIDIDILFTGDLKPLLSAKQDFVTWWDPRFRWNKIPGGIYLLRTGSMPHVWTQFDPVQSPKRAAESGKRGSDQGWMSLVLWPPRGWGRNSPPNMHAWTEGEGVMSIKWIKPTKYMPHHLKVISTPGFDKPWTPSLQQRHPWIKEHWRL